MFVTGIKQNRTLERKVRQQDQQLNKVFKDLFSKIINPELLK